MTGITGILYKKLRTFTVLSRWILLRCGNISHKSCRKNRNTVLGSKKFFFRKSCRLQDNVDIIWYSQTGHRRQHGACALRAR